jgi:proline iminopeptidase
MSIIRFVLRFSLWGLAIFMVLTLILVIVVRPVMHYWGTTEDEKVMALPGDDLLEDPAFTYTQAITINAPQEIVWAYLIQVGYQRAGWYNIDWINGMIKNYFYEEGQSANRIIPELQDLQVGDMIHIIPDGGFKIIELERNERLLMIDEVEEEDGSFDSLGWVIIFC